jgi:crescentin
MNSTWGFLFGRREAAAENAVLSTNKAAPLHEVGQRNELLHVRLSYMADRLEDLKSLADEFQDVSRPIEEIVEELPRAKARILEVEALLSREITESQKAKSELREITDRYSIVANENSGLANKTRLLQDAMGRSEIARDGQQIKLVELGKLLSNAQQQLTGEADNRQRLDAEIVLLTTELVDSRDALKAFEESAARHAESVHRLEREQQRLQGVVEKQLLSVVDLEARNGELEKAVQDRSQELAQLRHRIDIDHAEHQKSQNGLQNTISALHAERSSLALQVDALQSRLAGSEQLLAQTREHLSEKDAAVRMADDTIRVAERERSALARQVTVLGQNSSHTFNQLEESQRTAENLSKRCDMLSKALAAKDAALENAVDKARSRSERVEELTKRFEHERVVLEAAHRRLVEELENERAERNIAQGALKIARESRSSLQRLNESLKRANRSIRSSPDAETPIHVNAPDIASDESSNVSRFAPPSRDRPMPEAE